MSCKRSCEDQDPDYVENVEIETKRLRLIEKKNQDVTAKKIQKIIDLQFAQELKLKEAEIEEIDNRLFQARHMLDQLRAGIIVSYYSFECSNEAVVGKSADKQIPIHPAVKKLLGKFPMTKPAFQEKLSVIQSHNSLSYPSSTVTKFGPLSQHGEQSKVLDSSSQSDEDVSRLKIKKRIIVGNVSQYIPMDQRDGVDQSTHRWMVYVRGPKEYPSIHSFVSKVRFFLHPSYRPDDVVEICQPPFYLRRRGWGEFPVRLQIYFCDSRNKRFDMIHNLKLDKTYTGLQTLGAETLVDVQIFKENCVIQEVKEQQQPKQPISYNIPEDVGGISIPAPDVDNEKDACEENPESVMHSIKKEIVDETSKTEMCSVSSFMNDHGTYTNYSASLENVRNHNDVNSQEKDEPAERQVKIKQEPEDYIDVDQVPTQSIIKTTLTEKQSEVSLLNSPVQLSILRKDIGANKLNNVNSLPGKTMATFIVNANVNKPVTTAAVSILNCNQKLSGQSAAPKVNAALPMTIAYHKGASTSSTINNEAKIQLRGHSVSPANSTATSTVEQKVPVSNGVSTLVKYTDQNGKVYLIPWHLYLKWNPNVQHNLIRDTTQNISVPNSSSETVTNVYLNSVQPSLVKSEMKIGDLAVGGLKQTKVTNDASILLSKFNSDYTLAGVSKLKYATTTSNNKPILSLSNIQILTNDVKACASIESAVSINIDDYDDFSYVVRYVGKKFPLVVANPDRVLYPYCASKMEEFLNWNIGKRHAAEWHRSKAVKDKLMELIEKSTKWRSDEIWTTKQLFMWLRTHGYTPMKDDETNNLKTDDLEAIEPLSGDHDMCTVTDVSDLVEALTNENIKVSEDAPDENAEKEEEIDVITIVNQPKGIKKSCSPEKLPTDSVNYLSLNNDGIIVQETCREIGINLQVEELCPDFVGPLAETALLTAMKCFMEDMIGASIAEGFKRTNNKKLPSCINVTDVSAAIQRLPSADFLTNSGLGTKVAKQTFLNLNNIKL